MARKTKAQQPPEGASTPKKPTGGHPLHQMLVQWKPRIVLRGHSMDVEISQIANLPKYSSHHGTKERYELFITPIVIPSRVVPELDFQTTEDRKKKFYSLRNKVVYQSLLGNAPMAKTRVFVVDVAGMTQAQIQGLMKYFHNVESARYYYLNPKKGHGDESASLDPRHAISPQFCLKQIVKDPKMHEHIALFVKNDPTPFSTPELVELFEDSISGSGVDRAKKKRPKKARDSANEAQDSQKKKVSSFLSPNSRKKNTKAKPAETPNNTTSDDSAPGTHEKTVVNKLSGDSTKTASSQEDKASPGEPRSPNRRDDQLDLFSAIEVTEDA
jgi:hypothetical protein